MKAVLGFDTSCYTTSCALVGIDGSILGADRKLLKVDAGNRGLMQSEMVFQHVKSLPERMERMLADLPEVDIVAVSASTRPRPAEESYMPAFQVGASQARTAAMLLGVPFYPFSHQEGHVRAAVYESGIETDRPFLALHLSGGTTEVLLKESNQLTLLGGSLDLHMGQLIDRIGVKLNLPFPCGPSMEALAETGESRQRLGVSMRDLNCSISGAESAMLRMLDRHEISEQDAAAEIFDFAVRTIYRLIEASAEKTGATQALLAGGVASSQLIRKRLLERKRKRALPVRICFAKPELSGDNAVGIALLGADRVRETNPLNV